MNKISLRIADLRKEFWNQKLEYLLRTRKSYWNDDYTRFLISQVWKIDKPVSVLDCGCGYGFLGLLLLPYLPEGSTYTGIDFAEDLIKKGKALFESQNLEADFLCENVFQYSVKNQYDFVVCQAVGLFFILSFYLIVVGFALFAGIFFLENNRQSLN